MSEPTNRELLERIRKIDAVASTIAAELARQRQDIEELFRSITRDFANASAAVRSHDERLRALEPKVLPALWRTIQDAEKIIGRIDDPFQQHPLDRRDEEP